MISLSLISIWSSCTSATSNNYSPTKGGDNSRTASRLQRRNSSTQHESDDVNKHMPELIRRSLPEDALLAYDTSGMGVGNDVAHPSPTNDEGCPTHPDPIPPYYAGDNRQNRRVRDLSFDYFRGRLVEHFDILYQDNRIQWPTRMGGQNPLNS